MASIYRTAHEEEKRGPLTLREKAAAALSGLKLFEPLLAIASRALEEGLPREERLKAAAKLSGSSSTDRIFSHLEAEKDTFVMEALAYAFVEAYHRKMGELDMAMCSRYSALGARSALEEKDRYSSKARSQASAALDNPLLPRNARSALESVAYGRAQV